MLRCVGLKCRWKGNGTDMTINGMKIWNFLSLRFVTFYEWIVESFLHNSNDIFSFLLFFGPLPVSIRLNFNPICSGTNTRKREYETKILWYYFVNIFNGSDKENVESPVMNHDIFQASKKISRSYIFILIPYLRNPTHIYLLVKNCIYFLSCLVELLTNRKRWNKQAE